LPIEYVNERPIPSFDFFLLSSDGLELQDSFLSSSLIEMSSCVSGVGKSNLGFSCSGGESLLLTYLLNLETEYQFFFLFLFFLLLMN
jgi:hypothetical protein